MTVLFAAGLVAILWAVLAVELRRELHRRRLILCLTDLPEEPVGDPRWKRRAMRGRGRKQGRLGPKWWMTAPAERDVLPDDPAWWPGRQLVRGVAMVVAAVVIVGALGSAFADKSVIHAPTTADVEQVALPSSGTTYGYHVGSFQKQAGTGNQDVPLDAAIVTAMNAGPYSVDFFTVSDTAAITHASDTWYSHAILSRGLVASTGGTGGITQYAVGTYSADAQLNTITKRRIAAACLTTSANGTTAYWEATFSGTQGSTAMRLNWSVNPGDTPMVNYIIRTGLTAAKVVSWTTPTTTTTKTTTVSGVDLRTNGLVLHASVIDTNAPPAAAAQAFFANGMMNSAGQQGANGFTSVDSQPDSLSNRYQQTDACLVAADSTDARYLEVHAHSMGNGEFTTYTSAAASGNAMQVASLCMSGVSSKIGAFTKTDGTAPWAQVVNTRHGFTPMGISYSSVGRIPDGSPHPTSKWTLGATDFTNQRAVALRDLDAQSTTNADSVWSSTKSYLDDADGSTAAAYTAFSTTSAGQSTVTVSWNPSPAYGVEILYLLEGDPGTQTFPTFKLDTATTNAAATGYSNQKKEATLVGGRMVQVIGETTTNARFEWSDNGQGWTDYASDIAGWSNGSIDRVVIGSVEYLVAVWRQSGTGGGRTSGACYVMTGAFNAGQTTLGWGTPVLYAGADHNYLDIAVTADGTGAKGCLVASYNPGTSNNFTRTTTVSINSSGVPSVGADINFTNHGLNAETYPSVVLDPTGRAHVAWSAGTTGAGKGARYRTATFTSGTGWPSGNWAAEVEVDTAGYVHGNGYYGIVCRWDALRSLVVVGGLIWTGSADLISIWDSSNFTSFMSRVSSNKGASGADSIYGPSMAIEAVTGDVYLFGSRAVSTFNDVRYFKATRSGSSLSLGSSVTLDSFITSDTARVNAWYSDGAIHWIYAKGNNSPYAIGYDRIIFNQAPTASTWSTTSGPKDVNATLNLAATFNDPDPGDTPSGWALKRDIAGTIRYYRVSDTSWQVAEVKNPDTALTPSLAAGWGVDGDPAQLYYLKAWDLAGEPGPYSSVLTITPSAKVNPTLDTPAEAGTVGTSNLVAAWTVAQQTERRLKLYDAPGTSTLWDSGWITTASRSGAVGVLLVNGTDYRLGIQTKNDVGLESTEDINSFPVDYVEPATATLVVTAVDDPGYNVVQITNPAPIGDEPAVDHNEIYRRPVGDTGDGIPHRDGTNVAANGTFTDRLVGNFEDVEYRVLVVGANGTTSWSAWT